MDDVKRKTKVFLVKGLANVKAKPVRGHTVFTRKIACTIAEGRKPTVK